MNKKLLLIVLPILVLSITLAGCQINQAADSQPSPQKQDSKVEEKEPEMKSMDDLVVDGTYQLSPTDSTLEWNASRLGSSPHFGNIDISEGSLEIKDQELLGGEFTIDMNSFTVDRGGDRLIGHIKSDDFFAVDQYPESKIVIKQATRRVENNNNHVSFQVVADLTIRDQTHEVIFPATASFSEDMIEINADITIDRTRWAIIFDSGNFFQNLGDRAIKDLIDYKLRLVVKK